MEEKIKLFNKLKNEVKEDYEYWSKYMEDNLDFWHKKTSIHGKKHVKRVLLYGLIICKYMGVSEREKNAFSMAAIFHDTRRNNDGIDIDHGFRAAEYYMQYTYDKENDLVFDSRSYYAIKYHVLDDLIGIRAINENFKGKERDSAYLVYSIMKDADGLDRIRLGEDWLDPSYLRNSVSIEMIDFCREYLRNDI